MLLRSVLLLDFDNIYLALLNEDERAAKNFVLAPQDWLQSIKMGNIAAFPEPNITERRIISLKCYANPDLIQKIRARPSFVRAGFSVVDCPTLTAHGKNSADIHMVLDAVELLRHETKFDEFIILSADADFTPLLVKLRLHDRHTVIFSNHETAAAYKSVASQQLRIDAMLALLNPTVEKTFRPMPTPQPVTREKSTLDLGPIPIPGNLPPTVDLRRVQTMMTAVIEAVAKSSGSIPLAMAAQIAQAASGQQTANWGGYGSFGKMLQQHLPPELLINIDRDLLYDAKRFTNGDQIAASATLRSVYDLSPEFRETALRLKSVIDCPMLTTPELVSIFHAAASILADGQPFNLSPLGKEVRDRLAVSETKVARAPINFILRGVQLGGFDLQKHRSADDLAAAYAVSLVNGMRMAGVVLSPAEIVLIETWVGLTPPADAADPVA